MHWTCSYLSVLSYLWPHLSWRGNKGHTCGLIYHGEATKATPVASSIMERQQRPHLWPHLSWRGNKGHTCGFIYHGEATKAIPVASSIMERQQRPHLWPHLSWRGNKGHTWSLLPISLPACLLLCLSICLYVCLPVCLTLCVCVCVCVLCLFVCSSLHMHLLQPTHSLTHSTMSSDILNFLLMVLCGHCSSCSDTAAGPPSVISPQPLYWRGAPGTYKRPSPHPRIVSRAPPSSASILCPVM